MSDQSSTSTPAVLPAAEQVSQANDSGRVPVVFIHGLWLLPSSWDRWAAMFADAGYAPVSPGWPDDPDTVDQANADPGVFANKTIGAVADHYSQVILSQPAHCRSQSTSSDRRVGEVIATVQVSVLIAVGSSGAGQPAARSSPSAAITASRSVSATSWCTREDDSPIAVARVRIEIPSARAETSAHVRSRSACSSRHAARETRVRTRRPVGLPRSAR